jgi:hypothetical protein
MIKVYYQYTLGPVKQVGTIVEQRGNWYLIGMLNSQLPPVWFKQDSLGFRAIGTKNSVKFLIDTPDVIP